MLNKESLDSLERTLFIFQIQKQMNRYELSRRSECNGFLKRVMESCFAVILSVVKWFQAHWIRQQFLSKREIQV